jgi:hypothetical protein
MKNQFNKYKTHTNLITPDPASRLSALNDKNQLLRIRTIKRPIWIFQFVVFKIHNQSEMWN